MFYTPFEKTVGEMRTLGRHLLPYSFPRVSHEDEFDIAILKKREIEVDGYDVVVYFNNADYGEKILETLQVFGKNFSFLPFYLVCKIARSFLGNDHLSLVEVVHTNTGQIDDSCRKIYAWTLYYDVNGNKIEGPFYKNSTPDSFEGFKFSRIQGTDVKFF